jgi:hypothetical protein
MCNITGKSKRKTVTGYKVAYDANGLFYSPFTGVPYKVGKVITTDIILEESKHWYAIGRLLSMFDDYEKLMIGKTAVFLTKKDAIKLQQQIDNSVILKMKLSGDLYDAEFKEMKTVAGDNIETIERL